MNKSEITNKNQIRSDLTEIHQEIIEEQKKRIPKFLRARRKQFKEEILRYQEDKLNGDLIVYGDKTLPLIYVTENAFRPLINYNGHIPTYSDAELSMLYDYFRECVVQLNRTELFVPTKEYFCSLLGISTTTFNSYRESNSMVRRELVSRVEDFCANMTTQAGLQKKVSEYVATFTMKASLGRRDNDPININAFSQNTTIMTDSDLAKMAQNFNGVNLKPQEEKKTVEVESSVVEDINAPKFDEKGE